MGAEHRPKFLEVGRVHWHHLRRGTAGETLCGAGVCAGREWAVIGNLGKEPPPPSWELAVMGTGT